MLSPGPSPHLTSPLCQISCANYEARALGVRADMRICEAKRLHPDILVVPYLFEKYQVGAASEFSEAGICTLNHLMYIRTGGFGAGVPHPRPLLELCAAALL